MRKKCKVLLGILVVILFLCGGSRPEQIRTSVEEELENELEQNVQDQLDRIDSSLFDEFLLSLDENSKSFLGGQSFEEFVQAVTKGEGMNFEVLVQNLLTMLGKELLSFLPALVTIIIVCLLCGILDQSKSGFLGKNTGEIVHFVCYLAIVLIVVSWLFPIMRMAQQVVQQMRTLMHAVFPIVLTVMTAAGGNMSGKLFRPVTAILAGSICEIISGIVLPLFLVVTVLSVVSHLSHSINLNKLIDFFKSAALWINGICFTIFFAFLSVQGITAATYDGISIRAAKYAIGNSIPIVGGYLKEGFDLILGSLVIVKNAVGVCGLIGIIAVVAFPVLKIALFGLGLKLTAGIAEPVGNSKITDFLTSVSKNLSMLTAAILSVAFMFFLALMMLIVSSNAVLG